MGNPSFALKWTQLVYLFFINSVNLINLEEVGVTLHAQMVIPVYEYVHVHVCILVWGQNQPQVSFLSKVGTFYLVLWDRASNWPGTCPLG